MQTQNLLYAGAVATRTPWYMPEHRHDYHELIVLIEGELNLIINGAQITATAGDALFYPAGSIHEESSCPSSPFRTYFIGFTDQKMAEDSLPVRIADRAGRMQQLAHWIYDEETACQSDKSGECTAAASAFLPALIAEFQRLTRDDTPPLVRDIRAYINRRLAEPITVDDLAAQAGMSKFHFIRAYQIRAGCTPMVAVRRLRAEAARNLIVNTDLPLKQIAEHCGLSNPQHLSRVCRECFGKPPGGLRNT